jgi:DNA replication protein DnaC
MNNNSQQTALNKPIPLPAHDLGYYYDPKVEAGLHGSVKLSPEVEKYCQCKGKSPFMVYDPIRGEPTWCPCKPFRTKVYQISQYIKRSGIPAPFRYKFLSDFQERYENGQPIPGANQIKLRLHTLIDDIHNGKESLKGFYLWGKPGGGKTYFSYVMLNELIFKFVKPGKFISLSKSFQELRHTFDEGSETQGQAMTMIEMLSNVPYLVIDDFGVQRNTEWEMEILYNLIDARYANRRLTFVTTNQKIDELKQLAQGRIYSRFLEMCYIIQVIAPDFREMGNPEEKWVNLS